MAFMGAKGIVICLENTLTNENILTGNLCFLPFTKPETNVTNIHFMNCLTDNFKALSLVLLHNLHNPQDVPLYLALELPDLPSENTGCLVKYELLVINSFVLLS